MTDLPVAAERRRLERTVASLDRVLASASPDNRPGDLEHWRTVREAAARDLAALEAPDAAPPMHLVASAPPVWRSTGDALS